MQPIDSKFVLDFLSDELVVGEGDLKFISWNDFDKFLEDSEVKKKLTDIAQEKELDELKKLVYKTTSADEAASYNDVSNNHYYQQFVPFGYDAKNKYKYNDMENEVYYYHKDTK